MLHLPRAAGCWRDHLGCSWCPCLGDAAAPAALRSPKVLAADDDGVLGLHAVHLQNGGSTHTGCQAGLRGAPAGGVPAATQPPAGAARLPLQLQMLAHRPPKKFGLLAAQPPHLDVAGGVEVVGQATQRVAAQLLVPFGRWGEGAAAAGAGWLQRSSAVCPVGRRRAAVMSPRAACAATGVEAGQPRPTPAAPPRRSHSSGLEGTRVRYSAGMIWSVSMFCGNRKSCRKPLEQAAQEHNTRRRRRRRRRSSAGR